MKEKNFMEQDVEKRGKFVIEKIKRISISMDRGESWTLALLIGLFAVLVAGLIYYLFL